MKRTRCINIDWLEVYALESVDLFPCNATYFRNHGYFVRERDYGTRVYAEMFTILDDHDQPLLEIRRAPYSEKGMDGGFFPRESCHIRLANATCYRSDAITLLRDFMAKHNYTFKKIFRIDICLDFERFDKGDDPNVFMQRFIQGRYSKVNQANISAHGVDQWSGRFWNSLSWGNPKSMVSTKLYCKTLELLQVKDKPYIRYAWFDAGLIDDPVHLTKRRSDGTIDKPAIWRVEFSLKSSAQRIIRLEKNGNADEQIILPHTLSCYDSELKLLTAFASLAQHYFHFKKFEPDKRKDRCEDKVLFEFSGVDTFYKIDRNATHQCKNKPLDRLVTQLRRFYEEHPQPEVYRAVNTLIELIDYFMLRNMSDPRQLARETQAMQLLIKQRLMGIKDKAPSQQLEELQTFLDNNPELF